MSIIGALVAYKGKPAKIVASTTHKYEVNFSDGSSQKVREKDFRYIHPEFSNVSDQCNQADMSILNDLEEAGDITFVYAVCTFKDGTQEVVVIDRRRIEVAKKKRSSKGSKYSPWFTWFGEMAKKTAVKSLIKRIALSRTTKYYPSE